MKRCSLRVTRLINACIIAGALTGGALFGDDERTPVAPDLSSRERLRSLFVEGDASSRVGRVGVRLLTDAQSEVVSLGHVFRSGDRIQLEITSNRAGWLSVLHKSPAGAFQRLWPRDDQTEALSVAAGVPSIVPPSPSSFRFDEEAGRETFFVCIGGSPEVVGIATV